MVVIFHGSHSGVSPGIL